MWQRCKRQQPEKGVSDLPRSKKIAFLAGFFGPWYLLRMTTTKEGATSFIGRLFAAGAHFGHVKSRRHPSMKSAVLGTKQNVEIIDLAKTGDALERAKGAMAALARDGKTVLFVGGKQEISAAVKQAAESIGAPYVAGRWLGGTLTNFVEIKKRIDRLAELRDKRASGVLAKQHTKLELIRLEREEKRLAERLAGIETLEKRPHMLLIVDTRHEHHAAKEAADLSIPVIGILGSDNNMADAAYPIVANDASRQTVSLILGELASAFAEGRKG